MEATLTADPTIEKTELTVAVVQDANPRIQATDRGEANPLANHPDSPLDYNAKAIETDRFGTVNVSQDGVISSETAASIATTLRQEHPTLRSVHTVQVLPQELRHPQNVQLVSAARVHGTSAPNDRLNPVSKMRSSH